MVYMIFEKISLYWILIFTRRLHPFQLRKYRGWTDYRHTHRSRTLQLIHWFGPLAQFSKKWFWQHFPPFQPSDGEAFVNFGNINISWLRIVLKYMCTRIAHLHSHEVLTGMHMSYSPRLTYVHAHEVPMCMELTCHMPHAKCHMSHITWQMFNVTCHKAHVTCQISYFTCHMSHVTCHMSHVLCKRTKIKFHMSHVTYQISHVKWQMFDVTCHLSTLHVKGERSNITCDILNITCQIK